MAAHARLVELLRGAGRHAETAAQLERLAVALDAVGGVAPALEARMEQAEVLEHRLGDPAGALTVIEEALRVAPAERVELAPSMVAARAERRRLLAELGRDGDRIQALRDDLAGAPGLAEVASLLAEKAVTEERLGLLEDAAVTWSELAERAPDDRLAARMRRERHERSGDPRALAAALSSDAPGETSEQRARRFLRLGELHEGPLQAPPIAAAAYLRALPLGGDAAPHAALGLYRALARGGDPVALDAPLAAMGTLVPVGASRFNAAIAIERAAVSEAAGDRQVARERVDEALTLEGAFAPARFARVRDAARSREPAALATALSQAAARTADARSRAVMTARAAAITVATRADAGPLVDDALLAALPTADAGAIGVIVEALGDDPRATARRIEIAAPEHVAGLRADRVEALLARGRLGDAAAEVGRALASGPDDAVALEAACRIARRGGDRLGEARAQAALGAALPGREGAALLRKAALALEALAEPADAVAAWRALLDLHGETHGEEAWRRARELAGSLRDEGAVDELLTHRLSRAEGAERIELLLERAELRAGGARPNAAAEDYRAVLALDPGHRDALRRFGDLLVAHGDDRGATELYQALVDGPSGATREVMLDLAALHERHGQPQQAIQSLRRALQLVPKDPEVLSRVAELSERVGDYAGAVEALSARAWLAEGSERAAFELRAAALHRTRLRDVHAAWTALARALAADPLHLEALRELVALSESVSDTVLRDGALIQAAREAQRRIDAAPESPEPYRVLERICEWRGDDDARQLAVQAAAVVGGRPAPPRREGLEPSRVLPSELWMRLMGPANVAVEIFRETAELSPRFFGPDVTALGIGRGTRQNERAVPYAWAPIDRIALALNIGAYALHAVPQADTCAVAGDAIIVGTGYAAPMPATERFRVARKLALLRDRLGPLETASEEELELYLVACARAAGTEWQGAMRHPEAQLDDWSKRLAKLLDRRTKKALVALAPRFAELGDVAAWRRRVLDGATKIAMTVGGELGAALRVVGLRVDDPEARTLARFAVSEELGAARRAIGARV